MNILEKIHTHSLTTVADLQDKTVLLRIDVNTSLGDNNAVDPGEDWRILRSLDTIEFLQNVGARIVVLAHIGRDITETLKPVYEYMKKYIPNMAFGAVFDAQAVDGYMSELGRGQTLLMENLRQHEGERKNDATFFETLIQAADIYVNDAFSVSHREHASISEITKHLPSYFGLQFVDEVQHMTEFLNFNDGAKVLVLGGAKFGTKLPLLEKMLPHIDYVLMGGALANVFLRARGFEIGKSFCDDVDISHIADNQKIVLPIDYIDQHGDVADIYDVGAEDIILDIGPMTTEIFKPIIEHAGVLLWNGPMGKYEDGYTEGSIHVAEHIVAAEIFAITGGGDTSTLVLEHDLQNGFSFLSTGGGAMLDFLVDGTLPGIDAILKK